MKKLLQYFLRLGCTAFGGPLVLIHLMNRDLVQRRQWFNEAEFNEGLALAQLTPGPVATQLSFYLGWLRGGSLGALAVGVVFILPSFIAVLILAMIYRHYHQLFWLEGILYGIAPAIIALIFHAGKTLFQKTVGKDPWLIGVSIVNVLFLLIAGQESFWLVIASGIFIVLIRARLKMIHSLVFWPGFFLTSLLEPNRFTLSTVFFYFFKAGILVFGSGFAIIPFLRSDLVMNLHWLTDKEVLDAMAIGMITPGPLVITVVFLGYLLHGISGSIAASLGIFLPCFLMTILTAPFYKKLTQNAQIRDFILGVTSAATGAIFASALLIGKEAILDQVTALLFLGVFILLFFRKVPEPALLALSGAIGLLVRHFTV